MKYIVNRRYTISTDTFSWSCPIGTTIKAVSDVLCHEGCNYIKCTWINHAYPHCIPMSALTPLKTKRGNKLLLTRKEFKVMIDSLDARPQISAGQKMLVAKDFHEVYDENGGHCFSFNVPKGSIIKVIEVSEWSSWYQMWYIRGRLHLNSECVDNYRDYYIPCKAVLDKTVKGNSFL